MMSGGIEKGDMLSAPTGYGYPNYGPPIHGPPMHHDFMPTIHEQHIYLPDDHDDEEYHHGPVYHSKGKGHDLSIRDFFEIALTALAFLAFGLFIIQLLMNITVTFKTMISYEFIMCILCQKMYIIDGPLSEVRAFILYNKK